MQYVPLYPYKARFPALLYWPFRLVRTMLTAACFAGFWSGCFVAAWVVLPLLALWPGTRAQKMHRAHRAVRFGFNVFHGAMWLLRLYKRTSTATKLRPGATPCVIVANHPTLCDVTSIASLFPNVVTISRANFDNGLIGRAVRMCGFVPAGARVLRDCEERLRMGFDVLVFPEGTRTPVDGPLHAFHRGAFELAQRAQVPLVLVELTIAPTALSKGLPIWKVADTTAVLTITPFDVIDPGNSDSRALCRAVEKRYQERLSDAMPEALRYSSR